MPRLYEYYDESRYEELRSGLIRLMTGEGCAAETVRRIGRVRSLRQAARVGLFVRRELPMRFQPRPAIFRAPFLTFSARTMQQGDGLRVVMGMRHPGAWIESIVRRDEGFEFDNLLAQPALLETIPEFAEDIARFARETQPVLPQAILLWRVIQTFHARFLLGRERTLLVLQRDLVASPRATAERIFRFAGVEVPDGLDAFVGKSFEARRVDHDYAAGAAGKDYNATPGPCWISGVTA